MLPDDDIIIDEIPAEEIEAPNPIADFLKSVEDQNFNVANQQFNDMVGDRLQDTLDQAKQRIASAIYGDEEDEVEEPEVQDELDDYEDQLIADEEEELDLELEPEEESDDTEEEEV